MTCLHHLPCARPSLTPHHKAKRKAELLPLYGHVQVKGLGVTNLVSERRVCCSGLGIWRAEQKAQGAEGCRAQPSLGKGWKAEAEAGAQERGPTC